MNVLFLNNDIKSYIMSFAYPTKEQMDMWKMEHYIKYYKVMHDIRDIIIEVKIEKNGIMKNVYSLFSWSIIDNEWFSDDYWSSSDED